MLNQFKQALITNKTQNKNDIQEFVFYNDELQQWNYESYFIPHNDFNELNEIIENKTYFKLINKIKTFSIQQITNESQIYIFNKKKPNKESQICIQNGKSIHCQFQIDSMLINNKIQINKIDQHFFLPYDDCQQIYQLIDEIFLIGCKIESSKFILITIDKIGKIYDSLDFLVQNECKQQISIFDNMILLYEVQCLNYSIWTILVDVNKRLFLDFQQIQLNHFVEYNYGNVQFASFCKSNYLFISYENRDVIISIDNSNYYQDIKYDYNHIIIQENCQIQFNIRIDKQINIHRDISSPKFSLNYDLQNLKKYNLVNNNFICQINSELLIYHNQDINLTLNQVIDFAQIQKTPIIVTIFENQTIAFYHINQIEKWISYKNTKYQAILIKDDIFKVNYDNINIISTEKFDALNITTISNLEKNELKFQILENFVLLNNEFEQYSPLQLTNYQKNSDIILKFQNQTEFICQVNFKTEVIYTKALQYSDECQSIIYQIVDEKNSSNYLNYIQNCCNNQTIYFEQFSISYKKQNIHYKNLQIFIENYFELQVFQLSNDYQIINQQIIKFENEIISIQNVRFNLIIQLSNGKLYKINIINKNFTLSEIQIVEIFDESLTFLSIIEGYNYSQIKQNNQLVGQYFDLILKIDCKIIETHEFLASKRFLIVCLHQNNSITLEIYQNNHKELVHLYQIPLYNFTFVMPFKITYTDKLVCIVVEKQDLEGIYIFLYQIHQKNALKSLISVKKANHQIQYLMFDKSHILFYCGQNQCTLLNFNQKLYLLYQNFNSDELELTSKVTFTAKSITLNYEKQINLILNYINQLVKIRFRMNVLKQNQILYIDQQNNIMDLHKIFGPIINISLSDECNGTLMSPLSPITNQRFSCTIVYENFCYQRNKLIYDPFGIHIVIELTQDIFLKIKLILYDDFKLQVFYIDQLNKHMILEINNWRQINNQSAKSNYQKLNYELPHEELYQKNNILYTYEKHQIIILDPLNYQQALFQQEFENDQRSHIIFSEMTDNNKFNIVKIFISQNNNLEISYLVIQNGIILNNFITNLTNGELVIDFQTVIVKRDMNLLQIDVILQKNKYQEEVGLIFYLEIFYDLDTKQIVKENYKHYFRILGKHQQLKIINQVFLSIRQGFSQTNIYFYNLNQDYLSQIFTDYYFLYEIDDFVSIQKYNESFQLMVKNSQSYNNEIFLLDIQSYKYISNQNKCFLKLNNQLSSFNVLAMREQNCITKQLLEIILILNFFFIIFIISKNNKKEQKKVQKYNQKEK